MSEYDEYAGESERQRKLVYWIAMGLLIVFALIAVLSFHSVSNTSQAQDKADQYIAALKKAGARAPSKDTVVRVFGSDGGALCDDPKSGLRRAILYDQLTNGAGGPGQRPVIADNRVIKGQLLAMQVYCPSKLPDFKGYAENLNLDDVVKG